MEITEDVEYRHNRAFDPMGLPMDTTPESTGDHRLRSGSRKEDHLYTRRPSARCKRRCARAATSCSSSTPAWWTTRAARHTLRGLTRVRVRRGRRRAARKSRTRFRDREAVQDRRDELRLHLAGGARVLATAMNRLGGRSNSGEGGEDVERFGTERVSRIKQVASGARRDQRVPHERRRDPDQDGPRREARRGRAPARQEGLPVDREDPPLHPRRQLDFPAPAPRHILHRGPGAADLRLKNATAERASP